MTVDVPGWAVAAASVFCLYLLIWTFGNGK